MIQEPDITPTTGDQSLNNIHKRTLSELERYKLLVESVQDYAIFFMDTDGYIQTWNKGAQKTKGYRADEIIGKHFSSFYMPEDIKEHKPERELEIAKRVGRVEDEDWRVRKDGSKFWANVVITALYDEDNNLQGFAKVTRNLTERKEHEDSLRTANTLLIEQQKELQRLNESKDDFISLASHQLRTPATAIKQLLGLLIEGFEGSVSDSVLKIVQKTYESNERQIAIINSLLRVAQIDAGKVVLRKTRYDLNEVAYDLTQQYAAVIADRHQAIELHLSERPLVACVDEHYFRMALENILDNASKYSKAGSTIELSSSIVGDRAHMVIKDAGVGIARTDIGQLFEKFRRISNDMTHEVAGSGLGLYWAKKVIDLHQGTIEVESELGKGTTMHIYVPLGAEDA